MPGNIHSVTLQEIAGWPKGNYINPPERTWLPGFAIFWQVLSTIFVFGRLYVRARNLSGPFGFDDVLVFIAWAFTVPFTASACLLVWDYGIGRNVWDVLPTDYVPALYYAFIAQILFLHSTGACKTSILLFYQRMAKTSYSTKWLYTVYVLLFITIGSWISLFIAWCTMCTPLNVYWDIYQYEAAGDTNYTCINGDALTVAAGVLTIASDFWSAALPCAMFQSYDLGVSKRQKLALNIIFCLGFLVTGCGIARTYFLWQLGHVDNISEVGYDLLVSSVLECQLALICTCAPFFRVLLRRFFPDLTNLSRSNRSVIETDNRDSFIMQNPHRSHHSHHNTSTQGRDVSLEHVNEKKGFLLVENGAGRPVWGAHDDEAGRAGLHHHHHQHHDFHDVPIRGGNMNEYEQRDYAQHHDYVQQDYAQLPRSYAPNYSQPSYGNRI